MAKAKTEELLTGRVPINCDFRPDVPNDSLVLLSKVGITEIALVANYKITSHEDKAEVFRIVQTASIRIDQLEKGYKDEKAKAHQAHATICFHENEDKAGWELLKKEGLKIIRTWDQEQERIAQAAADKAAAEERERVRKAEAEARELQRKAQEEADRLRREGDMRAAREVTAAAEEKGADIVMEAEALADVGVIVPVAPRIGGLGSSRPWISQIDDPKQALGAIADGTILLTEDEWEKAREFLKPIATRLAKRMQKADIGWPGVTGIRDFGYRTSKTMPAPLNPQPQEKENW
jgi:hypothetical protein